MTVEETLTCNEELLDVKQNRPLSAEAVAKMRELSRRDPHELTEKMRNAIKTHKRLLAVPAKKSSASR